jgi:hypothetical protein
MKIEIEVRDIYGIRTIYPACDTAKLFARLAGTKTITRHALDTIRALGYTVEIKQPEVTI